MLKVELRAKLTWHEGAALSCRSTPECGEVDASCLLSWHDGEVLEW